MKYRKGYWELSHEDLDELREGAVLSNDEGSFRLRLRVESAISLDKAARRLLDAVRSRDLVADGSILGNAIQAVNAALNEDADYSEPSCHDYNE